MKSVDELYEHLERCGYSKKHIHKKLPKWWNDEIWETHAGRHEACVWLSAALKLDVSSVFSVVLKNGTNLYLKSETQ
jgi:hypothetical protein